MPTLLCYLNPVKSLHSRSAMALFPINQPVGYNGVMQKITWKHECLFCKRPILRGRPTLVFSTDEPKLVGLSHSTCCATKYRYGHFQMCPPDYLSDEQISFLVQFYHRLYSLLGGQEPNRELRLSFITFLQDYPASLANPMASLRKFLDEYKHWSHEWLYDGDLEADFLRLLGQIQREARENPVGVEVDFQA